MKIAILGSLALWFFVLSCLLTIIGFWGLSISTYDKGVTFPLLLVLSSCIAWAGAVATVISFMVLLGEIVRWSRK